MDTTLTAMAYNASYTSRVGGSGGASGAGGMGSYSNNMNYYNIRCNKCGWSGVFCYTGSTPYCGSCGSQQYVDMVSRYDPYAPQQQSPLASQATVQKASADKKAEVATKKSNRNYSPLGLLILGGLGYLGYKVLNHEKKQNAK